VNKRCSIYDKRPTACADYSCGWLTGIGPDGARPNESGLLVTVYPPHSTGTCSATIAVIDKNKCGTIHKGFLYDFLNALLAIGADSIRIISYNEKSLLHITDGKIYRGTIMPSAKGAYEALDFVAYDPPIGMVATIKEETPNGLG
jgi:hypothetical protein